MTVQLRYVGYVGAACLAAGLVAGRCWQGKAADARFMKLETAYAAHLRADSVANAQDNVRTDTVTRIRTIIRGDSAAADSLTRTLDSLRAAPHAPDTVFAAFARACARRDSLRVAEALGLRRIVAIQDSQLVALRVRVNASNALLAQAMTEARRAAARANRRWHLVAFAGYAVTPSLVGGPIARGPSFGIGLAWTIF